MRAGGTITSSRLTTDGGIVGWSEFDEGFGSPGVSAAIERLAATHHRRGRQPARTHLRRTLCRHPARPPAASWPRRSAPSRTRCSMPRQSTSACPATSCSAARSATASGSTGRTARRWRINHADWYKPAITDLDGVKAIGREVREKKFTALKTNIFIYEQRQAARLAARLRHPVRARAQCRPQGAAQPAHAPRSDARRRRPRRRHPARPQLQCQDRGLPEDPARDRRPRHVLDRDRHLQPAGAGLYPPPQPAPDLVLRDAAGPARVPALFPRAGDGCGDHRHALERRLAVDEDRQRRRSLRGQRRPAQFLRPSLHHDECALLGRRAEPAHHGDRHRSHRLGSRIVQPRAGIQGWLPDPAGPPGLGHRPGRGSLARPPARKVTGYSMRRGRAKEASSPLHWGNKNSGSFAMEQRRLGPSSISIPPLVFGGNVLGWSADEATSFKLLDHVCRGRAERDRYRRRLLALGAGTPGRRVRNHHRTLVEKTRQARRREDPDQVRHGDAGARQGFVAGLDQTGDRGLAEAPADRLCRSLPGSR